MATTRATGLNAEQKQKLRALVNRHNDLVNLRGTDQSRASFVADLNAFAESLDDDSPLQKAVNNLVTEIGEVPVPSTEINANAKDNIKAALNGVVQALPYADYQAFRGGLNGVARALRRGGSVPQTYEIPSRHSAEQDRRDNEKKSIEQLEAEKREHEARKVANANWYLRNVTNVEFVDIAGDNAKKSDNEEENQWSLESGAKWTTDTEIKAGTYQKSGTNSWVKVGADGSVRPVFQQDKFKDRLSITQKSAMIQDAMDFMGAHGETRIHMDFDSAGKYSMPLMLAAMEQAEKKGLEFEIGPGLKEYLDKKAFQGGPHGMRKSEKKAIRKMMEKDKDAFNKWLQENNMDMPEGDKALTAYLYFKIEDNNRKVAERRNEQGPAYEQAVGYDNNRREMEDKAKLARVETTVDRDEDRTVYDAEVQAGHRKELFGDPLAGGATPGAVQKRMDAVMAQMDAVEQRFDALNGELDALNADIEANIEVLENGEVKDIQALDGRLQVLEHHREQLREALRAECSELEDRLEACQGELESLDDKVSAGPQADQLAELSDRRAAMQAAAHDSEPDGAAVKARKRLDKAEKGLGDLSAEKRDEALLRAEQRASAGPGGPGASA